METTVRSRKSTLSNTTPGASLLPPIYTQVPKKNSITQDSPLLSQDRPFIPLGMVPREVSTSSGSPNVLSLMSPTAHKTGNQSPGLGKSSMDAQLVNVIDQLIAERPATYKQKEKPVLKRGFTADSDNLTKEQKILDMLDDYKKFRGLDLTKEKMFDDRLGVFSEVKTFIDARKLFQDPEELIGGSPSAGYGEMLGFANATRQSETRTPDGTETFVTAGDFFKLSNAGGDQIPNSPQGHNLSKLGRTMTSEVIEEQNGDDESFTEMNDRLMEKMNQRDEQAKKVAIRRMYQQLKESAIEKFGIGIFETAQKRLKDPEQVKLLQKKRQQDLQSIRHMKKELGNFDLGSKLISCLNQENKEEFKFQEEQQNRFDTYIEKELAQKDESRLFSHSSIFGTSTIFPASKAIENEPMRKEYMGEEEPHIKLLHKAQQLQERHAKVFKSLRSKITKVAKNDSPSSSGILRIGKMNSPVSYKQSQDASPVRFEETSYSQQMESSSPLFTRNGFGEEMSPPKKTFSSGFKTTMSHKPWVKSASMSQSKVSFGSPNKNTMITSTWRDESFGETSVGFGRNGRTPGKQGQQNLPTLWENNKKSSSVSALSVQKNTLNDICWNLTNLSSTNKDLNKQLADSIKEMDIDYAKKAKSIKNFNIPESLQNPSVKNPTNAAKVAALAAKICRTRKFE